MRKLLFLVIGLFAVTAGLTQTPQADFSLPETVCKDENIFLQNNSSNASTYFWDFCSGDLAQIPTASVINSDPAIDGANNITVVESEGSFYGFVTSRFDGKLIRLDFGDDLNNEPQLVDMGNFGSSWEEPIAVEVVQSKGAWYGFLVDFKSFGLFRLSFGSSLENTPSVEAIEQNVLNKPVATDLIRENGELILQVANFGNGNITSFNFGDSPANAPSLFDYNITNRPIGGISFIKEKGTWYGLATEFRDRFGRVLKLKYGNGLSSAPVVEAVSSGGVVSNKYLSGVALTNEGGSFYGFVQTFRSSEIYRLNFSDGLDADPTTSESLGNLGVLSDVWGITTVQNESTWKFFTVKTSGQIFRISFPNECDANQATSNSVEPKQISFSKSGTYPITLTAHDEFGNRDDTTQFITVTEDQAPLINFKLSSQCFGSTSTLTATADQTLTSADWSITNDSNTTETRTGQTVTYDFPTPGTYSVTLEVESDNGCGNRLTKEITIYEPPAPAFTAPAGTICTNNPVRFTNTTDAKGADVDSLITYRWFVDDELVSEEAEPDITFAEGGNRTVRLEASIPGCTEVAEQTINVLPGPVVSFNVAQACQGRAVVFGNLTTGEDITGYVWNFGDGGSFTSTAAESPSYTFDQAGTYVVTLSVTNELECQNVYRQEVTVYEQPAVGFVSEVACAGTPTQFTDTTTAGTNANVIAWQWDFGDGLGTASERNPAYAYAQPGVYAVKLITQTTAGCTDSTVQTITVESPVAAGFVATLQCPTEAADYRRLLSDTSVVAAGDEITRWFWTIGSSNFVTPAVEYSFPGPGDYPVSLTTFAASGCAATVTRTVRVDSLPQVDFTYAAGCTGTPVAFQSNVANYGGEISKYTWEFVSPGGGEPGTAFVADPSFTFDEAGTYAVTLTAQTAEGCAFTRTQSVTVAAAPEAAFTASAARGGAPLAVTFTNASTDATQYAWDFGGRGTSDEANPNFTFTELGTYEVTLTATNAAGCVSTARHTIEVVAPVADLRLAALEVVDSPAGEAQQLVLTIRNEGSRVASGITVTINLGDAATVQEQLTQPLRPGETRVYTTHFRLPKPVPNQRNPIRYLCARVAADEADFVEDRPDNNRDCLSLDEQLSVEAPFPNPAGEQMQVSLILPAPDAVVLRLMDSRGQVMRTYRRPNAPAGLNSFVLTTRGLPVGAYLLQVTYQGEQRQFRVGVRP